MVLDSDLVGYGTSMDNTQTDFTPPYTEDDTPKIETELTQEQKDCLAIQETMLNDYPHVFREILLTDGTSAALMDKYPLPRHWYPTMVFSIHGLLTFNEIENPDPKGISKLIDYKLRGVDFDPTSIFEGQVVRCAHLEDPQSFIYNADADSLVALGKRFGKLEREFGKQEPELGPKAPRVIRLLRLGSSKLYEPAFQQESPSWC